MDMWKGYGVTLRSTLGAVFGKFLESIWSKRFGVYYKVKFRADMKVSFGVYFCV